jgi:site-specific recombinase XerD
MLAQAGLWRRKSHIADGVVLRVVMELLGHSQISTTANTYGHVFEESLREAADAMDRALGT